MSFNFKENVNTMFEKLEDFFKSKTVIGESITVGDTVLIPIIDISIGLGLGGGDGIDEKGQKGYGCGGGLGAKGSPTAVIVIKGDNIELLSINKRTGLEKLIEAAPDLISKIKEKEQKSGEI